MKQYKIKSADIVGDLTMQIPDAYINPSDPAIQQCNKENLLAANRYTNPVIEKDNNKSYK